MIARNAYLAGAQRQAAVRTALAAVKRRRSLVAGWLAIGGVEDLHVYIVLSLRRWLGRPKNEIYTCCFSHNHLQLALLLRETFDHVAVTE